MRGVMGLLGLVMALAIGLFIYRSYFTGSSGDLTMGTNNLRAAADITGVKNDLLSMAQAERAFQALNGRFAPLERTDADEVHDVQNGDFAVAQLTGMTDVTDFLDDRVEGLIGTVNLNLGFRQK